METVKIKEIGEKSLVLEFSGSITVMNSGSVGQELMKIREEHKQEQLVFDFEKLDFVSSSGLRVLLNMAKTEKKKIQVFNVNSVIYEVLDDTGLGFKLGSYLDCYVIPVSENEKVEALTLCYALRMMGFKVDIDNMNRNVKNNFKQAEKLNAKFAIVVGEEELKEGYFTVKDMKNKSSDEVNTSLIVNYLMEKLTEEEDCSCMDDCCCDDDCDCSCECDCGDDCNCDEHHKCNDNCTCGDDCCCHDDDRCSEDCKCHKHND